MTLLELSALYQTSGDAIVGRIRQLEELRRRESDPNTARTLRLRIEALTPLLREMRELTLITAHYYDR